MAVRLVVNADDLGVSRGATLGILRAHREGIVTSASLAVTTPFYEHAVETCVQSSPELGIGLHFTLTSGRPQSPANQVPLLVDERGNFRWRFMSLLAAVRGTRAPALLSQIEIELEAQLARLRADGIRPDHLDGERHVHLIPGVFELVVAAAKRHGIEWVRAGTDYGTRFIAMAHLPGLILGGGFAKSWLLSGLAARNRGRLGTVRSADWLASYLYSGRTDLVVDALSRGVPDSGVLEVMVHPGIPEQSAGIDLGNRELERYLTSGGRRRELYACIAGRGRLNGAVLTSFARLTATVPAA